MRMVLAALLLSACATAGETGSPAERVAGCWIDRNPDRTTITMRWFPDPQEGGYVGDRLFYGINGPQTPDRFTLRQHEGGWQLCEARAEANQCWQVAEGESGSLEGGRAFIDTHGDRLRISVVGMGAERTIYHGSRDGCD